MRTRRDPRFGLLLLLGGSLLGGCGGKEPSPATGTGASSPAASTAGSKPAAPLKPGCKPGDPFCDPRFAEGGIVFDLDDKKVTTNFRDIFRITTPKQPSPDGQPTVVVFPHRDHATKRLLEVSTKCKDFPDVSACTTCHHQDIEQDKPRRCSECHKAEDGPGGKPSKAETAFHTRCMGCHKSVNERCADLKLNVALRCEQCHKAPSAKKSVKKIEEKDLGTTM